MNDQAYYDQQAVNGFIDGLRERAERAEARVAELEAVLPDDWTGPAITMPKGDYDRLVGRVTELEAARDAAVRDGEWMMLDQREMRERAEAERDAARDILRAVARLPAELSAGAADVVYRARTFLSTRTPRGEYDDAMRLNSDPERARLRYTEMSGD